MGRLISLIYFYLVSIIGLVLLIIGLYNAVSYTVNITQYNKYPLRYAGNENCDYLTRPEVPEKPVVDGDSLASLSAEEREQQKQDCEKRVETERKQTQVNDIKNAIYFTLIGALLLGIHLPIALRKSAEKK